MTIFYFPLACLQTGDGVTEHPLALTLRMKPAEVIAVAF